MQKLKFLFFIAPFFLVSCSSSNQQENMADQTEEDENALQNNQDQNSSYDLASLHNGRRGR